MPEADPIALWVMADRTTRRLLGVQIVGGRGAGKRIDAAASVLWFGGTVDALAWMEYLPTRRRSRPRGTCSRSPLGEWRENLNKAFLQQWWPRAAVDSAWQQ